MFPFFFGCCWNITWKRYIRVDKHTSVTTAEALKWFRLTDTHTEQRRSLPACHWLLQLIRAIKVALFYFFYILKILLFRGWLTFDERKTTVNGQSCRQVFALSFGECERRSSSLLVIDWSFARLSFCFVHVQRVFVRVCVSTRYHHGPAVRLFRLLCNGPYVSVYWLDTCGKRETNNHHPYVSG